MVQPTVLQQCPWCPGDSDPPSVYQSKGPLGRAWGCHISERQMLQARDLVFKMKTNSKSLLLHTKRGHCEDSIKTFLQSGPCTTRMLA
ncbi:Zinc Finger And Btb Domain-Containing Protein 8B [Manis pentadactyla]|nr:Zinc Finger And Btb Domain-Containing Protein 8B [Manis pentadactyla]